MSLVCRVSEVDWAFNPYVCELWANKEFKFSEAEVEEFRVDTTSSEKIESWETFVGGGEGTVSTEGNQGGTLVHEVAWASSSSSRALELYM